MGQHHVFDENKGGGVGSIEEETEKRDRRLTCIYFLKGTQRVFIIHQTCLTVDNMHKLLIKKEKKSEHAGKEIFADKMSQNIQVFVLPLSRGGRNSPVR